MDLSGRPTAHTFRPLRLLLLALLLSLSIFGCKPRNSRSRPTPPPTHLEMTVAGLGTTAEGGKVVLLIDPDQNTIVPIFIGGTEALSIQLRLDHQHYQRPLTHDLLDSMVRELGGELEKVQVDDLRDSTYIGTVFLRDGRRVAQIDARPSDAIALALGNEVPIFVARKVVEAAGVKREEIEGARRAPKQPPGVDPLNL